MKKKNIIIYIMHEIQNMCVLIFFDNIYCCQNGSDGWMIMALDCGWGGEGSKINLNYYDNDWKKLWQCGES